MSGKSGLDILVDGYFCFGCLPEPKHVVKHRVVCTFWLCGLILGIWSAIGVVLHQKLISRRANWIRNKELRQLTAQKLDDTEITLSIDQINSAHDQSLSLAM